MMLLIIKISTHTNKNDRHLGAGAGTRRSAAACLGILGFNEQVTDLVFSTMRSHNEYEGYYSGLQHPKKPQLLNQVLIY
jgi:hypothetical protein